jgi:nucleoside phosphorylase/CheY-like chemotaxis protein
MSIFALVVDDDEEKLGRVVGELVTLGLDKSEIYTAGDAAAARKILYERSFDLLLLDLNLPERVGSVKGPAAEVGLGLLRQIVEDEEIPAPSSIVGITSDSLSLVDYRAEFDSLTTQILFIDPINTEWKHSLKFLVGRINNKNQEAFDADIFFLTALREPEQTEILKLPLSWSAEESLGNGILIRRGSFEYRGITRKVVTAHSNQMGPVASAYLTGLIIQRFRPRLLFMTGICGGIGNKPKLGDIIFAEKSWDWQSGKWSAGGKFEIAPDPKDGDGELLAFGHGIKDLIGKYHLEFPGSRPKEVPKILHGPMVSGSAVVADKTLHDRFITQHRKSVGVDMECYGVYFSASMATGPKPKVLCLKAVSDLANRQKSDDFQEYCSYITARAALDIAKKFFDK